MAELEIQTRQVPRSELLEVFGRTPRLMKAIESLFYDVVITIPNGATADSEAIATAQGSADAAAAEAFAGHLGIYSRRQNQQGVALIPGDLLTVTQTAAGPVVSLDLAQLLGAVRSMSPRQPPQRPSDDADLILASRVFGK